jgi:hypothetical protein
MSNNCPVCNKAGLPDYKSKHTVCPQCNSDLKPFLLLQQFRKSNSNRLLLFGISVIAIVFVSLYLNSSSENNKITNFNSIKIVQLQDSINNLRKIIDNQSSIEKKTIENEIVIQYKVRKHDCTAKVAHFFYNDWKLYKKIESDNNLQKPYVLKVGQILKIKITQP